MEQILQQLQAHVWEDQKFFSARAFRQLSAQTGFGRCQLAQGMALVLGLYLEFGECAFFMANCLLIAYPFMITYVFPEERPARDLLLVYWGCFALLTAFDRFLEAMPFYYILKMCLLALFFLEPCSFAEKINKLIEMKLEEYNMLTSSEVRKICRRTGRSPVPQKPVDIDDDKKSKEEPPNKAEQKNDNPETLTKSLNGIPPRPVDSQSTDTQSKSNSTTPSAGGLTPNSDVNIMANDPKYRLGNGVDNKDLGPESNIHDLLLWPQDALIFNAPFNHDNLTYHMKMMNNSQHRMAFAVKGNAIPRVTAHPAHGILSPKEKMTVTVTVKTFDSNPSEFNNDRICWEYVLLKDDDKVEKFSHRLLQSYEWKRRKNIKILYNI